MKLNIDTKSWTTGRSKCLTTSHITATERETDKFGNVSEHFISTDVDSDLETDGSVHL